ncbi:hypothetical protein ACEPAI_8696 [Sanghuangporus weigelae]
MDTAISTVVSLPEEILENIMSYALLPDFTGDGFASKTSVSALPLVCRSFNRIAKPFLYSHLHLRTRSQSDKLADLLSFQPTLGAYIRGIRVDAPSASGAFLVAAKILSNTKESPCRILDVLDIGLVSERGLPASRSISPSQLKEDLARLNSALSICPNTICLIVRQDTYIGWNAAISFAHSLASCVERWQYLEAVDLRMRPTPVPAPPGSPRPDPLAAALAKATNLRVLRAHQPTLLNRFLLDVASNPALKRIELLNTASDLPDRSSYFGPYLCLPFIELERYRDHDANVLSDPASREPQCYESFYKRFLGHIGPDPELLEAAAAELDAQLLNEPQTLFASQVIAHPRLCELVRAGRLQLIMERLLMSGSKRCLGGDSREGYKDSLETLPSSCHKANQKLSASCRNGCLQLQSKT